MSTCVKLQEDKKEIKETTEKVSKTYVFDSVLNVIAGLLIHQIFLIFGLPALIFSLKSRENIKETRITAAKSNSNISRSFNLACHILLFIYLLLRLAMVIIHLNGHTHPFGNYQPPSNSIFFSFIGFGLRG